MTGKILKLGTRGSPLAMIQAEKVKASLEAAHAGLAVEIVPIKTSGDWRPEQGETRLAEEQGGKGMFAREIERALLEGAIDFGQHCLKDMDSNPPEGLALDHVLERASPFDAFICHSASSLMELPEGAVVGTSSMRRQAFLLHKRPDLRVEPLRGNLHTRLEKLRAGQVDATFLAVAGLERLGIAGDYVHPVAQEDMLPACGQGTIVLETKAADTETRRLLDAVHNIEAGLCAAVERAALHVLDGSCRTPIGAYARKDSSGKIRFDLAVAAPNGERIFTAQGLDAIADTAQAHAFGAAIAAELKERLPAGLLL